jgi:hypothetical protein
MRVAIPALIYTRPHDGEVSENVKSSVCILYVTFYLN